MNEIHKHEINNNKFNNPSPNRFNNPTTLKKTSFMNKNINKERTNTPTNKETSKIYTNTSTSNNNIYNDKNKTFNTKIANHNQKAQQQQGK